MHTEQAGPDLAYVPGVWVPKTLIAEAFFECIRDVLQDELIGTGRLASTRLFHAIMSNSYSPDDMAALINSVTPSPSNSATKSPGDQDTALSFAADVGGDVVTESPCKRDDDAAFDKEFDIMAKLQAAMNTTPDWDAKEDARAVGTAAYADEAPKPKDPYEHVAYKLAEQEQEKLPRSRFYVEYVTPDHELWSPEYSRDGFWAVVHMDLAGADSVWDAPFFNHSDAIDTCILRNKQPVSDHERALLEKHGGTKEPDWREFLELASHAGAGYECFYRKNGKFIGDVMISEDGFYRFFPMADGGYWSADVLASLALMLDEMNEDWQTQIDNDPAI